MQLMRGDGVQNRQRISGMKPYGHAGTISGLDIKMAAEIGFSASGLKYGGLRIFCTAQAQDVPEVSQRVVFT